jgi:hypothetical protein
LNRERADTSGRADYENAIAGIELRLVAKGLQRRTTRDRQARGLLERQMLGLRCDSVGLGHSQFPERSLGYTEDVLADREAGDARPDGLDGSCEIAPDARVLRRAEACDQTDEQRLAADQMPVGGIDRRSVHADAHLAFSGRRRLHLSQLEDVGWWPVTLVYQRRHTV